MRRFWFVHLMNDSIVEITGSPLTLHTAPPFSPDVSQDFPQTTYCLFTLLFCVDEGLFVLRLIFSFFFHIQSSLLTDLHFHSFVSQPSKWNLKAKSEPHCAWCWFTRWAMFCFYAYPPTGKERTYLTLYLRWHRMSFKGSSHHCRWETEKWKKWEEMGRKGKNSDAGEVNRSNHTLESLHMRDVITVFCFARPSAFFLCALTFSTSESSTSPPPL